MYVTKQVIYLNLFFNAQIALFDSLACQLALNQPHFPKHKCWENKLVWYNHIFLTKLQYHISIVLQSKSSSGLHTSMLSYFRPLEEPIFSARSCIFSSLVILAYFFSSSSNAFASFIDPGELII